MKTFDERYGNEILTDNTIIQKCEQCKDCMFRTVLLIHGEKCERYKNSSCGLFKNKLIEIMDGDVECEFYEKGDPVPQEWIEQNYISPHNRE